LSLGNVWLGSMIVNTVSGSQSLATNSLTVASVIQSVASVCDWVAVSSPGSKASSVVQVSVTPVEGTAYCSVIYSGTLTGVASVFYQPTRPLFLYPGDAVTVYVPNSALTGTANVSMRVLM
jgi:hypothetical protein